MDLIDIGGFFTCPRVPKTVEKLIIGCSQIASSTLDGNVEFVHSQYSCILTLT